MAIKKWVHNHAFIYKNSDKNMIFREVTEQDYKRIRATDAQKFRVDYPDDRVSVMVKVWDYVLLEAEVVKMTNEIMNARMGLKSQGV